MEANTAVKFNSNYVRLPQSAPFAKLSMCILQVIGEVYSFTGEDKGGNQLSCHRSYKKFMERCGVRRATVGRALYIGRTEGLIKGNRKDGFECLKKSADDKVLYLLQWAIKDEFQVRENEKRRLTPAERKVYAFMFTRCTRFKNSKRTVTISIADIAAAIGLSERTVQKALWTLIRAGLIYRPKGDKGTNRYKISRYTLNYKLVLAKEKNAKKIRKEAEKALKRQAEPVDAEPFPEFPSNVGEEQFVLHTKRKLNKTIDYNDKGTNSQESMSEKWFRAAANLKARKTKLHIIEVEQYKKHGELEFDFSGVSDDELKSLFDLYSPVIDKVDVISETFIRLIRNELKERKSCDGGSPPRVELLL